MRSWLKRARGVLIIPSLLKAGFLIGGEGGRGVLLGRDEKGAWSQPAFYSIGSGSFGLQIGFKDSQVMFVIMTESALKAMIDSKFKLGADASVAAGPTGVGVGGSTSTNVGADIYSFALNRGAFLGASFEGTIVVEEKEIEESYYGPGADARGIVLERRFANPASSALIRALSKN
jgi:lipid-binding SYLF domain-containing protein